jgi:hypothetical protein
LNAIAQYIRQYFRSEWKPQVFGATALLLALSFAINYGFDFETNVLRQLTTPWEQAAFFYVFYAVPYLLTLVFWSLATQNWSVFRDRRFWFLFQLCFVTLAIYVVLHNVPFFLLQQSSTVYSVFPPTLHTYLARYASNLLPGIIAVIPVGIYWYAHDRTTSNLYGFSTSNIRLRTYVAILLILIPIIFAASLDPDFREAYPRYKFGLPTSLAGGERHALVGLFQVCYGFDFVFVELFFRGFMVMAFVRFLGSGSILPMVVVYAFIHFQKPMGEALGSIFGGLALGIISYNTKSIYGGVILHLGVAYLMELAGSLHMMS